MCHTILRYICLFQIALFSYKLMLFSFIFNSLLRVSFALTLQVFLPLSYLLVLRCYSTNRKMQWPTLIFPSLILELIHWVLVTWALFQISNKTQCVHWDTYMSLWYMLYNYMNHIAPQYKVSVFLIEHLNAFIRETYIN